MIFNHFQFESATEIFDSDNDVSSRKYYLRVNRARAHLQIFSICLLVYTLSFYKNNEFNKKNEPQILSKLRTDLEQLSLRRSTLFSQIF